MWNELLHKHCRWLWPSISIEHWRVGETRRAARYLRFISFLFRIFFFVQARKIHCRLLKFFRTAPCSTWLMVYSFFSLCSRATQRDKFDYAVILFSPPMFSQLRQLVSPFNARLLLLLLLLLGNVSGRPGTRVGTKWKWENLNFIVLLHFMSSIYT